MPTPESPLNQEAAETLARLRLLALQEEEDVDEDEDRRLYARKLELNGMKLELEERIEHAPPKHHAEHEHHHEHKTGLLGQTQKAEGRVRWLLDTARKTILFTADDSYLHEFSEVYTLFEQKFAHWFPTEKTENKDYSLSAFWNRLKEARRTNESWGDKIGAQKDVFLEFSEVGLNRLGRMLTGAQAMQIYVNVVANLHGVSAAYTVPKYCSDWVGTKLAEFGAMDDQTGAGKIGKLVGAGTIQDVLNTMAQGTLDTTFKFGWGKAVDERKIFKELMADWMVQAKRERIKPEPVVEGKPNTVRDFAQKILTKIEHEFTYMPGDWKESMKRRVEKTMEQYEQDCTYEEERFLKEVGEIGKEFIGSKISSYQAVKDLFNSATLAMGMLLYRGIGYGVLASVQAIAKEYHSYERANAKALGGDGTWKDFIRPRVLKNQFLRPQRGVMGLAHAMVRAPLNSSVGQFVRNIGGDVLQGVGFMKKSTEEVDWKKRGLTAVQALGTLATFYGITTTSLNALSEDVLSHTDVTGGEEHWWEKTSAAIVGHIDRFQAYAEHHGGAMNAIADAYKTDFNNSFLYHMASYLGVDQLHLSGQDVSHIGVSGHALHEPIHTTDDWHRAATHGIEVAHHDTDHLLHNFAKDMGLRRIAIADTKQMIGDFSDGHMIWRIQMMNNPVTGMPGYTILQVNQTDLNPPISLFDAGSMVGKSAEECYAEAIANFRHHQYMEWDKLHVPHPIAPDVHTAIPPHAAPPPPPVAEPKAPAIPTTPAPPRVEPPKPSGASVEPSHATTRPHPWNTPPSDPGAHPTTTTPDAHSSAPSAPTTESQDVSKQSTDTPQMFHGRRLGIHRVDKTISSTTTENDMHKEAPPQEPPPHKEEQYTPEEKALAKQLHRSVPPPQFRSTHPVRRLGILSKNHAEETSATSGKTNEDASAHHATPYHDTPTDVHHGGSIDHHTASGAMEHKSHLSVVRGEGAHGHHHKSDHHEPSHHPANEGDLITQPEKRFLQHITNQNVTLREQYRRITEYVNTYYQGRPFRFQIPTEQGTLVVEKSLANMHQIILRIPGDEHSIRFLTEPSATNRYGRETLNLLRSLFHKGASPPREAA